MVLGLFLLSYPVCNFGQVINLGFGIWDLGLGTWDLALSVVKWLTTLIKVNGGQRVKY